MSINRKEKRLARHARIRRRIGRGTAERPRMAVFVSNKHMYVQFIDDVAGRTLAAASTLKLEGCKCNLDGARQVGETAAAAAKEKGIKSVIVDRGGFKFHGRVKTIVDSAVAAGLSVTTEEA
ncbi:MAG: 50S ribosomal protein L18 [Kiritimatiellia bacterium]|nr:50S ribosomal protein L18 [Kiritimatiellia bacterium]